LSKKSYKLLKSVCVCLCSSGKGSHLPRHSILGYKRGSTYFGNSLSVVGVEGFLLRLSAGVETLGSEHRHSERKKYREQN